MSCNIVPIPNLNVGYCELKEKVNEIIDSVELNCNNIRLITSGEFTPTYSSLNNITSVSDSILYYQKVGNYVFCNVVAKIDISGGSSHYFNVNLPTDIASNFTSTEQAFGVATLEATGSSHFAGIVKSVIGTKLVFVDFIDNQVGVKRISFSISYKIN